MHSRTQSQTALPPALSGDRQSFAGLNVYVAGEGPPLLLIHSINAAASAAEVRPLFEYYRRTRTVFAPDLPGFGLSERSDRDYTPRLMTDALHRLAGQIQRRCGNTRIDAIAQSLGCEFLARAAAEQPRDWGRLGLVSPTGLNGLQPRRGSPGSTWQIPWLLPLLRVRLCEALFRGLTRPQVVRYFLERSWGSKAIDETLWRYAVQSARQPGARFAPQHFLAGKLFSADIHDVYDALSRPVWIAHGVRGDFKDFRGLARLRSASRWQRTVFDTGAMPYFEVPHEFLAAADGFFAEGLPAGDLASKPTLSTQGASRHASAVGAWSR